MVSINLKNAIIYEFVVAKVIQKMQKKIENRKIPKTMTQKFIILIKLFNILSSWLPSLTIHEKFENTTA